MVGSIYQPQTWQEMESSKVVAILSGTVHVAIAGQATNLDVLVPNDCFVRDVGIVLNGCALFGDKITVSLVDKDGVYVSPGTVLSVPVTAWNAAPDLPMTYSPTTPQKLLGGLYLRFRYESTGATNVDIGINLSVLACLV